MDDAFAIRTASADDDHFVEHDGARFAGRHLLIDFWQARHLKDTECVERALCDASAAAGATVLRLDLHRFESSGGVAGVAILAESHISIHTWPERGYAAIDIFMCGDTRPYEALPILTAAFEPQRQEITEHWRGIPA